MCHHPHYRPPWHVHALTIAIARLCFGEAGFGIASASNWEDPPWAGGGWEGGHVRQGSVQAWVRGMIASNWEDPPWAGGGCEGGHVRQGSVQAWVRGMIASNWEDPPWAGGGCEGGHVRQGSVQAWVRGMIASNWEDPPWAGGGCEGGHVRQGSLQIGKILLGQEGGVRVAMMDRYAKGRCGQGHLGHALAATSTSSTTAPTHARGAYLCMVQATGDAIRVGGTEYGCGNGHLSHNEKDGDNSQDCEAHWG
ncbi:hypothetical protein K439DRAFT_1618725 [Ramaria rubella]|nr:hypothetical protein K439DRAFT_1618725 [Ramaria rubella]